MNNLILLSILSYLIGSIPFSFLIARLLTGRDIRKFGSKNVGATNVYRVLKDAGKKKLAPFGFLICWILDMAKGAFSIFLAQKLFAASYLSADSYYIFLMLAGFFVVLGHNYSVFLRFTGGRGAASLMGIMLYMKPLSLLVWGAPVLVFEIIAQIVLEKMGKMEKLNWGKFSDIFETIVGKQIAGRMAGLILAPFTLYFYDLEVFFAVAGGTILLLVKNIPRFEDYFKKVSSKS